MLFNFDIVSLGELHIEITIIMSCYDFSVKSKNPGSEDLWGPYWKRVESYRALNDLKMLILVSVSI